MTDYRIKDEATRREYFYKYFLWSLQKFDCDPSMYLLNYVHTRMELNVEQRYWLAWLYGNTYQLPTAWVIANEFPDFENVDQERLEKWNSENYKRLRYQNDQKWQKGHLPRMFASYREQVAIHGNQGKMFDSLCASADACANFNNLYGFIKRFFYKFGRYSAWFYMQTLKETCGLNVEPPCLLLEEENTHAQRDGLCYALAMDELVGCDQIRKNPNIMAKLNLEASNILKVMHEEHPELNCDMFLLETALCAFKKTFRVSKGRYLGYYLDRQYDDIKQVEADSWPGIDFDLLYDGRNEILDPCTNGSSGISRENMSYFMETGLIKFCG